MFDGDCGKAKILTQRKPDGFVFDAVDWTHMLKSLAFKMFICLSTTKTVVLRGKKIGVLMLHPFDPFSVQS